MSGAGGVGVGVFYGGSVLAAVVAGAVALFAPCCISVLLPAYFASSFHHRRLLVAMTFLFGAGVATVVLPIALGAAVVQRLMASAHTPIYLAGGALLLGLGGYTLAGGEWRLPLPGPGRPAMASGQARSGTRSGSRTGPLAVWSLGVFSGVASACCAPVLAGVVALSGLAASFTRALGLGLAYVFGMVAPLFVISLAWERLDWSQTRLFRQRSFTWRVAGLRRTVTGTGLVSGGLLVVMGAAAVWIAAAGAPMASPSGWQARFSAGLQHQGAVVSRVLAWLPGWAVVAVLAVAAGLLARQALRQTGLIRARHQRPAARPAALDAPDADGHTDEHAGEELDEYQGT